MKNLHLSKVASLVELLTATCTFCGEEKDVLRRMRYARASVCTDCSEQISVLIRENTPFPDQIDQIQGEEDTPF